MFQKLILLTWLILPVSLYAQPSANTATPAAKRIQAFQQRTEMQEKSLIKNVPFHSIGPSIISGRVADVEVWEKDPSHFYVAYASGGLWKTDNNGQSFTPLFDDQMVMTIGDIAVDWERNTIWIGSGEVNSSRSSYAGMGMFKSMDGGKTWEHKGLPESHHIGRVILDPSDPNTLWVAVLGHLYTNNPERGVYKTTDGGNTWKKVLFVDTMTGAVDLVIDPQDPDVLYAATWQRIRKAWDFTESGKGSAIYKSTDKGETWSLMTPKDSGFPSGDGVGRIGLASVVQDGKTMIYAVLDNQNRRPQEEKKKKEGLTKDELRGMTRETFLELEEEVLKTYLKENDFPEKYTAESVKEMVRKNEIKPIALVEYLEDANSLLFDTPVIGAEVYGSKDGGKSWSRTHQDYLDDLFYSYGYYFGQIRTSAIHPERLYIFGVPIVTSDDGGKTWEEIEGDNVHGDHHALWVNPQRDGHLILGNDGGINISYDNGKNWVKCNTPAVGQFYHIAVDMADNYNVYGGLQDNGSWYGPHNYKASTRWHSTGQYPYKSFSGGDGMQTAVDTRDNITVYGGSQFGSYYRIDTKSGKRKRVTPMHGLGERPNKWNWQSPIHLSVHNQDILYLGAQKLFRSLNQGDDWEPVSGDLTYGGKPGDVPFGTLSAIHESPLQFGLLYVGTDDGLAHVSRDGGQEWQKISDKLPQHLWVSRIQASAHEKGRVYISLNGYRNDDFTSYLYVSENFGQNWTRIGMDLPAEPVNVVKEDPVNQDVIYVGTDHGAYLSLDRGQSFMPVSGIPNVPVHDLVVHPRENHLIIGTHGRSLYLGDISPVQQLTQEVLVKNIHTFTIEDLSFQDNWGDKRNTWSKEYSEPDINLTYYVQDPGPVSISIQSEDLVLNTWTEEAVAGLNYSTYHGQVLDSMLTSYEESLNKDLKDGAKKVVLKAGENDSTYLQPGKYKVVFTKNGEKETQTLVVKRRK